MRDIVPHTEISVFEDYYGESHKDAQPNANPITHNLKKRRNITTDPSISKISTIPFWFDENSIHEVEKNAFPYFFCDNELENDYKNWRNTLIEMYKENPHENISISNAKKKINCDSVNLIKILNFLEKWGLVNYKIAELQDFYKLKKIKNKEIKIKVKQESNFEKDKIKCKCGEIYDLFFSDINYNFVCKSCLESGNYEVNANSSDFIKFNEYHYSNIWDKKDDFLLFDSIDKVETWDDVSKIVGKTKEQCIIRFLKLDTKNEYLEKHLSLVEGNIFNNFPNPLMNFIAFLCGSVHPKVANKAANWALRNLNECYKLSEDLMAFTVQTAKEQLDKEEDNLAKLTKILIETQIKKVELKMSEFEELTKCVEKERKELQFARSTYLKELEELKRQLKKQ